MEKSTGTFDELREYKGSLSNIETQTILIGNREEVLNQLISSKKRFNYIFQDISFYFFRANPILREKYSNLSLRDVKQFLIKLESKKFQGFMDEIYLSFKSTYELLSDKGILAIALNGSVKSKIKILLDEIFGIENFINEIIIDSPFKVFYGSTTEIFERTNYILLYSKEFPYPLKPIYNTKSSGGYWHSFVSKGQGKPKSFIIAGKHMILTPPTGTHWKLNQKRILELCKEKKIRLNSKGSPEYWVTEKKGQIIDTNWLDLESYSFSNGSLVLSKKVLNRLIEMYNEAQDQFILISPNPSLYQDICNSHRLIWIGIQPSNERIGHLISIFPQSSALKYFKVSDKNFCERKIPFRSSLSFFKQKKDSIHDPEYKLVHTERFSPDSRFIFNNTIENFLISGDNLHSCHLLRKEWEKRLKAIYIDPPFFTGVPEKIIIPLKGSKNHSEQFFEEIAYKNTPPSLNAIDFFRNWFYFRIRIMKHLLCDDGFIFVRFDYHFGHYAQELLDMVFGQKNFVVELIVRRMKKNLSNKQAYHQKHLIVHSDSIYVYRVSKDSKLNLIKINKKKRKFQDFAEIEYPNDNIWVDIAGYEKVKKTWYPTENSEVLLRRILEISTSEKDFIGDFFAGSGTTLAVAEKMKRGWIGADISSYSIQEIKKRIFKNSNFSPFNLLYLTNKNDVKTPLKCSKVVLPSDSIEFSFEGEYNRKPVHIKAIFYVEIKTTEVNLTLKDFQLNLLDNDIQPNLEFNSLVDYWSVDWYSKNKFNDYSFLSWREFRGKKIIQVPKLKSHHKYHTLDKYLITFMIVDVIGNILKGQILVHLAR
ncbi:DNA methyltransferase [Candidatus Hodarchaeum mangrovi]